MTTKSNKVATIQGNKKKYACLQSASCKRGFIDLGFHAIIARK